MNIQAKDTVSANERVLSGLRGNHKPPYTCSSKQPNKRAHAAYLIPSHWLRSEERTGQLNRKPFLIILWLVLRHSEQNSSCICCWEKDGIKVLEEKLRGHCTQAKGSGSFPTYPHLHS